MLNTSLSRCNRENYMPRLKSIIIVNRTKSLLFSINISLLGFEFTCNQTPVNICEIGVNSIKTTTRPNGINTFRLALSTPPTQTDHFATTILQNSLKFP